MNKFLDKQKVTFQKILIANAKKFPIPATTPAQKKPIIDLVDSILAVKKKDSMADTSKLEKEIDNLVYELYGLSPKEIAIVEGIFKDRNDKEEKVSSRRAQATEVNDNFFQGEDL